MLTHGNVVADFSGFLKVTEVNKADSLTQVPLEDILKPQRFFCVCFLPPPRRYNLGCLSQAGASILVRAPHSHRGF